MAVKELTPVTHDPRVQELQTQFDKAKMDLAQFQARVSKYQPIMDARSRATTERTFSDDEVFEATHGWEESLRDLSFCEMELRSLTTKLNAARREAVLERVAPIRQSLRTALKTLYAEIAKASKANSEVLHVYHEAREVLGEAQHEIPNLSWSELLTLEECDRSGECTLDFRKRKAKKDGWL